MSPGQAGRRFCDLGNACGDLPCTPQPLEVKVVQRLFDNMLRVLGTSLKYKSEPRLHAVSESGLQRADRDHAGWPVHHPPRESEARPDLDSALSVVALL